MDLEGAVAMCNNASGALLAFRKGSFFTTFLQQSSMSLAQAAIIPLASMLYLHAPGQVLIDVGVEDLHGHSYLHRLASYKLPPLEPAAACGSVSGTSL